MANIFSLYNSLLSAANKTAGHILTPNDSLMGKENASDEQMDFGKIINDKINDLNNSQVKADNMIQDFISGETDDLHSVMIASEEARISLELAVQVRNKCIEAYKEINNMQL